MSSGDSPALARLHALGDEFERCVLLERDAWEQWCEPRAAETREARERFYLEAVKLLFANPDWLPEIATVIVHDTSATSLDALAQQLGQTVTWWIREQWRERAPRTPQGTE